MHKGLTKLSIIIALTWAYVPAEAIPVFARKYGTSCQTCHVAYPKLTSFGEAFRRNGYRWPAGEEEDATVQEPVMLGQPAHRRVFPNTVWPGTLPSGSPLSVHAASWMRVQPEAEQSLSFDQIGGSAGITMAGSLGDTFSGWAGIGVRAGEGAATEVEIERIFAVVQVLDTPALNLRVGRFEPAAAPVTMHRNLGPAPWIVTTGVQNNGFTMEPVQAGVEINGVVADGRLGYAVGVVEGSGNLANTEKDYYGRLEYKIGGMRLDGEGGAVVSEPWRDPSVRIGAFGYLGFARIGEEGVATQGDMFWTAGGDVDATVWDLNLLAAFSWTENERPSLADPLEGASTYHVFAQLDYVALPWLVPGFRYERRSVAGGHDDRLVGQVYFLLQANIRGQVIAVAEKLGDSHFDLSEVLIGLNAAF